MTSPNEPVDPRPTPSQRGNRPPGPAPRSPQRPSPNNTGQVNAVGEQQAAAGGAVPNAVPPRRTADVLAGEANDNEEGGLAWAYLAFIGLMFVGLVVLAWSCQAPDDELVGGLRSGEAPVATTAFAGTTSTAAPTTAESAESSAPAEANITAIQSSLNQLLEGTKIKFAPDSTEISEGEEVIAQVAEQIRDTGLLIKVEGYTDSVGEEASNQLLSERRAEAIKDKLVGQNIEASRISTEGFGETQANQENPSDRQKEDDRRIEIKLSTP